MNSGGNRVEVLLRNCPPSNGLVLIKAEKKIFVAMTRDNSAWLTPLYPDSGV